MAPMAVTLDPKWGILGRILAVSAFGGVTLVVLNTSCQSVPGCPKGKACVRYMAWGNPEQLDVERQMIADFNAKNPDVFVKLFVVPNNAYGQKMVMMLASKTAPDVMRIDMYNFPKLATRDYFLDLTELAKKDPTFKESDFFPTAISEARLTGKLQGMNVLGGGHTMYYNKSLFKQAGLADPFELSKKGEWTYDRFLEAAQKITKFEDGRPVRYGYLVPSWPGPVPFVWGFGGDFLTADKKKSLIDSPETIKAYQFLSDLIWKYKVSPTPAQGANGAFTFESGKVGMISEFMGMTPRFRKVIKNFEWDVCPIPTGPVNGNTFVKGNLLVIANHTKQPDAAWRFVRYMTSESTELNLYAKIRRAFPSRKSVAYSKEFLKPTEAPFQVGVFTNSIEKAKPLPINDRWGEWTQILNSEVDNLISGRERNAAGPLKRAKIKIDKLLSEDPDL
jgi:multiple sugar transport system substrate-binding protein